MQLKRSYLEGLAFLALFLFAIWFYTLPIQGAPIPFGDVDASSHFTIGDHMVTQDRSIAKLPYSLTFRYQTQNSGYPGYIWYPPQYWTNTALAQLFGGERIVPFFFLIALFSCLIILTSAILIRELYGFWPAFLSSFLLIFSTRDFMVYLWGQWPQALSFAMTPLILYSFYSYLHPKESSNPTPYLYLIAILLSAQFLIHPQGLIASIGALGIFGIYTIVKQKRFPIPIKHALLCIALLIVLSTVTAPLNIKEFVVELTTPQTEEESGGKWQFDKLFKWYHGIKGDPGLPDFYFTYNQSHGSLSGGLLSWWTLPFLLIGLAALFIRRSEKDWLLLSWFLSFYILTRLVVIGFGSRDIRMFGYEAHVFYPIIVLGLLAIPSILPMISLRAPLKYSLIALFFILAIAINFNSAYDVLHGMQNSIGRITPAQLEASDWVRLNLPEQSDIYAIGTLGYQNFAAKIKWLGVLSQRHFLVDNPEIPMTDYIFLDYSDAILMGNEDFYNSLRSYEAQLQNATLLYDKNNIKVYQVGIA